MELQHLKDQDLLSETKRLCQLERQTLMQILRFLREIERRKLYCDLGYYCLFTYVVKELKYGEGQASRRIQAMRLIQEIPQVEKSIASGELNLSNASQAQRLFRDIEKARLKEAAQTSTKTQPQDLGLSASPQKGKDATQPISKKDKLAIINSLKNKTTREAEKLLASKRPQSCLPEDREKVLNESACELKFVLTDVLKSKLETVRSLLGPKGARLSYGELFNEMADLSLVALEGKRFGKKRAEQARVERELDKRTKGSKQTPTNNSTLEPRTVSEPIATTPNLEHGATSAQKLAKNVASPQKIPASKPSKNVRYIPQAIKHQIWKRDRGTCCNCGGQQNLNIDHVQPVALGGKSEVSNLRLLCFNCNQRAGMKVFGVDFILSKSSASLGARK